VEAGTVRARNMHCSYCRVDVSDLYDYISNTHGGVSCGQSCSDKDRLTVRIYRSNAAFHILQILSNWELI
jgi:hypothetical protein